jgi:hypothetical protein
MNDMTWLWILLWLLFSAFVLGTFFWSTIILIRQKKSWKEFAERNNLTYEAGRFLDSAVVTGDYKGHVITLASLPRQGADPRDRRFVSVIEVNFPQGILDSFAIGTQAMHAFIEQFDVYTLIPVKAKGWNEEHRIYAANKETAKNYLNETRLKHIAKILSTKNADVIIMFDAQEGVVRIETIDPIQDGEKAGQVIDYIVKNMEPLFLTEEEKPAKQPPKQPDTPTEETEDKE